MYLSSGITLVWLGFIPRCLIMQASNSTACLFSTSDKVIINTDRKHIFIRLNTYKATLGCNIAFL